MATTPNLGITLLEQSQSQKEVTVNEAFTLLDTMVGGKTLDVRSYGAKPDCRRITDLVATNASTTVTSATANFSSDDIGKVINIYDFTNNNYIARTTIASVTNATTAVLTAAASASLTASNGVTYLGTDNATAIGSALTAASALIDTTAINDNQPLGGGRVRVVFPCDSDGVRYLFGSQLTVGTNIIIDAEALLVSTVGTANNNTNGTGNRTYAMIVNKGAWIHHLELDCCYTMGIKYGTAAQQSHTIIDFLSLWSVGGNYDAGKTPAGQKGLELLGNDYFINRFWGKGGNILLHLNEANDIMINHAFCIGAGTGLQLTSCEEVQIANSQFDTISYNCMSIDGSHNIRLNGNAFSINSTSAVMGLAIGQNDSTNKCRNLNIDFSFNRIGGDAVRIANVVDSRLDLNITNAAIYSGGGVAITNGLVFGSGISGSIMINATMDKASSITPTTGTVFGNVLINGHALPVGLTDATNISWNPVNAPFATVTLGGNRTLTNPTYLQPGTYHIIVKQDATGNRTLAYGSNYKWPAGSAPVLTTTANAIDMLTFKCDGTYMYGVAQKGFA
jgi:hypothetical protein